MRLPIRWSLLPACALVAGLLSALAVLPARWLIFATDADWPIAIVDATGTVWNGTALLAVGPPGARRTAPEPVSWHWGWGGVDVTHPWLLGPLRLTPTWHGISVSAQSLRAPADMLASLGAPFNTFAPAGQIELQWPAYTPGSAAAGTLLDIHWRDAASALSSVHPLGDYRLLVTHSGKGGAALTLSTQSGMLQLQGSGTWDGHRLRMKGKAEPAPDAPDSTRAALSGLLSAVGLRNGDQSTFGTDMPP